MRADKEENALTIVTKKLELIGFSINLMKQTKLSVSNDREDEAKIDIMDRESYHYQQKTFVTKLTEAYKPEYFF